MFLFGCCTNSRLQGLDWTTLWTRSQKARASRASSGMKNVYILEVSAPGYVYHVSRPSIFDSISKKGSYIHFYIQTRTRHLIVAQTEERMRRETFWHFLPHDSSDVNDDDEEEEEKNKQTLLRQISVGWAEKLFHFVGRNPLPRLFFFFFFFCYWRLLDINCIKISCLYSFRPVAKVPVYFAFKFGSKLRNISP